MTLSVQFTTLIVMVSSGIYLGIARDTFQRLSIHWKGNAFATYVLEICFWLLQTLIVFYCLFLVNAGELRLYIVLACFLGFSFYQALLKNLYLRVLEKLISVFRAIFRFLKQVVIILVITPLRWLILLCSGVIVFIFRIFMKLIEFILQIVLFPIRLLIRIVKPILPKNLIKFFHKFESIYSTIINTSRKWLKYLTFKRR